MRMSLLATASVLAVLILLPHAAAQTPMTFNESYQVRGAVGDIPTTTPVEPSNAWNLEQRFTVQFNNASQAQHSFLLSPGSTFVNATCTCNPAQYTLTGGATPSVTFTLAREIASGTYTLTVTTTQAASRAFGFEVFRPGGPGDGVVILYVPTGYTFDAPAAMTSPGLSTDGKARIRVFSGSTDDPLPQPFWAAIHLDEARATSTDGPGFSWVALAIGVVAGAIGWALLVSRGIVQRKSRKQVVGVAAHEEAAANDPPEVLEGKRRALMAALKSIELARQANEMPVEVYNAVKADLKKQAVTVMRALEQVGGEKGST